MNKSCRSPPRRRTGEATRRIFRYSESSTRSHRTQSSALTGHLPVGGGAGPAGCQGQVRSPPAGVQPVAPGTSTSAPYCSTRADASCAGAGSSMGQPEGLDMGRQAACCCSRPPVTGIVQTDHEGVPFHASPGHWLRRRRRSGHRHDLMHRREWGIHGRLRRRLCLSPRTVSRSGCRDSEPVGHAVENNVSGRVRAQRTLRGSGHQSQKPTIPRSSISAGRHGRQRSPPASCAQARPGRYVHGPSAVWSRPGPSGEGIRGAASPRCQPTLTGPASARARPHPRPPT